MSSFQVLLQYREKHLKYKFQINFFQRRLATNVNVLLVSCSNGALLFSSYKDAVLVALERHAMQKRHFSKTISLKAFFLR